MSAMLLLFDDDGQTPAFSANFMSDSLPAGLTYTNSSKTRTYFGSDGLLKTAAENEPIFETLGGVFQGMRWEMEQRTNLATNSEGEAATWFASNVVNAATPIDGFSNSLQFGDNAVARFAYKSVTLASGTLYNTSIFVQMDDGLAPSVGTSSGSGDFCIVSDGFNNTATATVQRIAGNIYRVGSARTATTGGGPRNCGIAKYTGQSARTFRVIGIQVEAAASTSSYIPTAAAAVTRQPDVLTATSISPWYNQSEGTVVFEGILSDMSIDRGTFVFLDGTNNNRQVSLVSSNGISRWYGNRAGTGQHDINTGSITVRSVFRHAVAYRLNDFASAANGSAAVDDTSGALPIGINKLQFGVASASGGNLMMGYARRFDYYRRRLPNAQLQGMSRV